MIGVLEAKKVPFEKVDIAKDHIGRALLKRLCKNSNTQPPVITKGEQYLGVCINTQTHTHTHTHEARLTVIFRIFYYFRILKLL